MVLANMHTILCQALFHTKISVHFKLNDSSSSSSSSPFIFFSSLILPLYVRWNYNKASKSVYSHIYFHHNLIVVLFFHCFHRSLKAPFPVAHTLDVRWCAHLSMSSAIVTIILYFYSHLIFVTVCMKWDFFPPALFICFFICLCGTE